MHFFGICIFQMLRLTRGVVGGGGVVTNEPLRNRWVAAAAAAAATFHVTSSRNRVYRMNLNLNVECKQRKRYRYDGKRQRQRRRRQRSWRCVFECECEVSLCECEVYGGGGDGAESACERQPREPKKRQQQKTCLPPLWRSLSRSLRLAALPLPTALSPASVWVYLCVHVATEKR